MMSNIFQNPIVDYIFDFLVKQAIQHGPTLAKKVWEHAKRPRVKQQFVPRVGLIDRERELRAIKSALVDVPRLRILYFTGEGGVGKTRLLEEAKHLIEESSHLSLCWGGILDLYHTELHSTSSLQAAIVKGLDPVKEYFHDFRSTQERINSLLSEGLTGHIIETEREKLNDLFLEEYQVFAQEHRPVIAFDTLESLAHESDWIEHLCNLQGAPIATREWLIEQIAALKNSVILMAGRPEPSLIHALEVASGKYPGQLETIELRGLTRESTHELLELLLRKAPPSLKPLREKSDQLWQVTRGLPVQLALAVDLAYSGEAISANTIADNYDAELWGKSLVNMLFPHDRPDGRVFFLLALARKGMTPELLHYLEPEKSKIDCYQELESLQSKSITKLRPEQDELFLHDVLYELFDNFPPNQTFLQPWYSRLSDYYRAKYQTFRPDINDRSNTVVNLLYYELQQAPRLAFESVYLKLREIALKGHELELDLELRDEILRFMRNPIVHEYPIGQDLSRPEIDRDGAVRWIKRYVIQSRYQQAILVAETILALGPGSYPKKIVISNLSDLKASLPSEQIDVAQEILNSAGPFFWGHLLTYYGEALVYTGVSETKAQAIIAQGVKLLSHLSLDHNAPLFWLRCRVLGRAYNILGYLLRSHGHYDKAFTAYQHAQENFEQIDDINDEKADTLNNIAFILALLGASKRAIASVNQALELRQSLGQHYPLALSYNTRGLIYSSQGQHGLGRRDCQVALNTFEELEMPRGIGLACNAIGYILRKQGEGWKSGQVTTLQAVQSFQQSVNFLERAVDVFDKQVLEPIRLWESYNEQGSLFREWGFLLTEQKEIESAAELYSKSTKYQLKALEIAQQYKMHFQEADTYDDLAKIFHDQGDIKKAKHLLKQALSIAPKEYVVTPKERTGKIPAPGEAYWLILGKAHWQEGLWALQFVTKGQSSSKKNQEYAQRVIINFTLAAYYFERYWPDTSIGRARLQLMVDQIQALALSKREIKKGIRGVAARYSISVKSFLNTFSS